MNKLKLNEKDIIFQYEKLKNINETAKFFNISVSTVLRRLKNNNVKITRKYDTLNKDDVIEQYSILKNIHKVAEHFNISITPIKKILKMNGINVTNRRYDANHNYFDVIDTEDKAYWLGFIFADGYIRERKSGNSLDMKLSLNDKEHLELFKKSIDSTHVIMNMVNEVKYKGGVSKSKLCHIAVYSSKLVESIKKQGVHSRKTFTIERPNINPELINHFIRGYFDGDGSFTFIEKKCSVSSFACASDNFRNFLIEELSNNGINMKYYGGIQVQTQNKFDNLKFYNYIYKNATIYLKRKKDKYEKFRRYYGYNN
jgi:intein-encoded DNA endonuclease-like protein